MSDKINKVIEELTILSAGGRLGAGEFYPRSEAIRGTLMCHQLIKRAHELTPIDRPMAETLFQTEIKLRQATVLEGLKSNTLKTTTETMIKADQILDPLDSEDLFQVRNRLKGGIFFTDNK